MKIFLSAVEQGGIIETLFSKNMIVDYLLVSYYYLRNAPDRIIKIKKVCNELLIDSGAHSFQKGKKVDWLTYTKEYASWIKKYDCPKILGFFEMDVDNIIGYDKVLQLRKTLEKASNKIIPVWHKNRGIDDYKQMCNNYPFVAITGFKNEDVQDNQYMMFLKYAKQHNTKVHCLGLTRTKIMNNVPFYSVDSSSWKQGGIWGMYHKFQHGKFLNKKMPKSIKWDEIAELNFFEFVKAQKYYKSKWGGIWDD